MDVPAVARGRRSTLFPAAAVSHRPSAIGKEYCNIKYLADCQWRESGNGGFRMSSARRT